MHDHPHYPPPASQQQDHDSLGQDLYRGAEIVMIVVAIFGLWKYHRGATLGERHCSFVELVAEELQQDLD